ncbi:hypothetical protein FACS1894214_4800 [Planctomycetales bacterium]|nr:hypothetical protein FACS1894214_4800 [Planctomycetales bacterium]
MFDIDDIVQRVLADLTAVPAVSKPAAVQETAAADGVYISDKVISLSTIKEQLGKGKRLFIPPKSILTPSAKDEIKKRNIEIAVAITDSSAKQKQTIKQEKELLIAEVRPAILPKNILNRLRKTFLFEFKPFSSVEILSNEIKQKCSAAESCTVVITDKSAAVLQLLNRNEKIRAVSGSDAANIAEDIQETNANVLVLRLDRIAEIKIFEVIGQFFSR